MLLLAFSLLHEHMRSVRLSHKASYTTRLVDFIHDCHLQLRLHKIPLRAISWSSLKTILNES